MSLNLPLVQTSHPAYKGMNPVQCDLSFSFPPFQHIPSNPDCAQNSWMVMMALVPCPGIYTSTWSCPYQPTLSFTAASGTTHCLLFQIHTCWNLASANPSLSITVIIWANPLPGINRICGGIKAWMNLTHHILSKIHVPGSSVYKQQYYTTCKSGCL